MQLGVLVRALRSPKTNFTAFLVTLLHSEWTKMDTSSAKLKAAILIVSETASRDPSTDKGVPALQDVFAQKGGDKWTCSHTKIVPDSVSDIQTAISEWTDGENAVNLVLTSGGTGFTQKDNTPEVTKISSRSSTLWLTMDRLCNRSSKNMRLVSCKLFRSYSRMQVFSSDKKQPRDACCLVAGDTL